MNTSDKTLLQLLVEELPKHGGWPEKAKTATQSVIDGEIYFRDRFDQLINSGIKLEKVVKLQSSRITRDQYEAVLAEKEHPLPWDEKNTDADGWIDWAGGECPLEEGTLVDVRYRCGDECHHVGVGIINDKTGSDSGWCAYDWTHDDESGDIIAYRLHQPREAEKTVDHFEGAPEWAMLRVKHKIDGDEYFIASMDEMKYQSIGATIGRPIKFSHQHWDVIATREPQDANSRANDDRLAQHAAAHSGFASTSRDEETDLNDCIGQPQEDTTLLTHSLLDEMRYSGVNLRLDDAYELAAHMIDVGYRKQ